jgi:hypothetical protein
MLTNAIDFDKNLHFVMDVIGKIGYKKRLPFLSQTRVGLHKNDRRIWSIIVELFDMLCVIAPDTNEFHQD